MMLSGTVPVDNACYRGTRYREVSKAQPQQYRPLKKRKKEKNNNNQFGLIISTGYYQRYNTYAKSVAGSREYPE